MAPMNDRSRRCRCACSDRSWRKSLSMAPMNDRSRCCRCACSDRRWCGRGGHGRRGHLGRSDRSRTRHGRRMGGRRCSTSHGRKMGGRRCSTSLGTADPSGCCPRGLDRTADRCRRRHPNGPNPSYPRGWPHHQTARRQTRDRTGPCPPSRWNRSCARAHRCDRPRRKGGPHGGPRNQRNQDGPCGTTYRQEGMPTDGGPGRKRRKGPSRGPSSLRNPAASYSPRGSLPKYHRRWWA
jgi:hypothetical protein